MDSKHRPFDLTSHKVNRAASQAESLWRSLPEGAASHPGSNLSRITESHFSALNRGASFLRQPPRNRERYTENERAFAAEMLLKLKRGEDVRKDKVENLRDLLSTEDYENHLKLDVAVERLLDDLRTNDTGLLR